MSVEMISALFFFVGLAPHPTQNFLERKFRGFKELQNKKWRHFIVSCTSITLCKNLRGKEVRRVKQSIYKNKEELPMFLTVMDVAGLLGISRASAYELVREDNFPKLKIVQGRTIIPRDRLLEWLDEQTRYSRV